MFQTDRKSITMVAPIVLKLFQNHLQFSLFSGCAITIPYTVLDFGISMSIQEALNPRK